MGIDLHRHTAVIEAASAYRWLHKLLSPAGDVLLAHPFRLRVMVQRRSKTDRPDAMLRAQLLRIDQILLAYVPSDRCQLLRETTRQRCRLTMRRRRRNRRFVGSWRVTTLLRPLSAR